MINQNNSQEKQDWRLEATAKLTEPFKSPLTGQIFPVGSSVILVSEVKFEARSKLQFPHPNTTAIFLSISQKTYSGAQSTLKNKIIKNANPKVLKFSSPEAAIDFWENISVSVVFAYCALESFANEQIPDDYKHIQERRDKKCQELYNKEQIERFLNLDFKFDKVLTSILGIKSPKGKKIWSKYLELKKLRDRIVHLKSQDKKFSGPEEKTIWRDLLKIDEPYTISKNLIDYFLKSTKSKPQWFIEYPFK